MEEVEGIIQRFNQTSGKPAGIMLDNQKWYNGNDKTGRYVEGYKDKIGSKVKMKVNGTTITYIEMVQQAQSPAPQHTEENIGGRSANNRLGVTTGMALNNAANWINTRADPQADITPEEWAKMMCDCAEALLNEMDARGM